MAKLRRGLKVEMSLSLPAPPGGTAVKQHLTLGDGLTLSEALLLRQAAIRMGDAVVFGNSILPRGWSPATYGQQMLDDIVDVPD